MVRGIRALLPVAAVVLVALACPLPAGADVAYLYDDLSRLSRVIRADGEAATYHYDAVGNILKITRESGTPQTTSVSSVSTSSAGRGARVTITISGVNLSGAALSTLFPGLTILNVRSTVDGITFDLVIDDEAPLGPATIVIAGSLGEAAMVITITFGAPAIASFSPAFGAVGDRVTIQGQRFDERGASFNAVTFNGVPAVVQAVTQTSIRTSVPRGATSGPIRVTTANGTAVSAMPFTFTPTVPVITSFLPIFGAVGDTVAIQGQHFDERGVSFNAVTFNAVPAVVQTATSTSITASVPAGATSGPIRVTTVDGTAVSPTPFGVLAGALTPVGTITSPFRAPLDVTVSADGRRAFVMDVDSVKVVDTATHTVVRTIPVTNRAEHGVRAPDGTRLYVTGSGPTSVLDLVNGVELTTIAAGGADVPGQVALTPDGRTLYIANRSGNAVSFIDTTTNTLAGTLAIADPVAVTASPNGQRVYVMSLGGNTIAVVNPATNTVVASIAGAGSLGIFSPDGSRFYHDGPGDDMTVIDTASNAAIGVIPGVGEALYLAIGPDGRRLYAARLAPGAFETSLAVIDLTTKTVVASVAVPPGFPDGMVLTPDGQRLVLVYDLFSVPRDAVTVVDTTTNSVVASIPLNGEEGLGVAAVGNRLVYVTMTDTGNVSVVDLLANAALDVPISRTGNPQPPMVFAPNGGPGYGPAGSTTIASFDPSALQPRRNLSVTRDPDSFDIDPAVVAVDPVSGGTLYVANASFLHFVSAASGAITATLAIPDIASLFPSPDGSRLVALGFFGDVTVVDTVSRTPVATLSLGVISDVSVRNASGTRLYLADAAAIYVVDLAGPTLATTIPVSVRPDKLVLSGDGGKLFALRRGDARLVVVDTTTNAVVATLSPGGPLQDIAASPTRPQAYLADGTANSIRVVDTSTSSVAASIAVPASPTRVAVSPNGARLFVVQGPAGLVSVIDVQSAAVTSSLSLPSLLGEIAVAPNNRLFIQKLESPFESGFLVRRPLVVIE